MKTIFVYCKSLLLSCACTAIGNAVSEICIAIFIRNFYPEYGTKALSFLDVVQKFGRELAETPVTLILMTIVGFIPLAFALRKQLRKIYSASIVWGSFMGIYGANLRFICMTHALENILSFFLPTDWDLSDVNFFFFCLTVPLMVLAMMIIFFRSKAWTNRVT
ncbi:hypothetical protein ACO0LF_17155 [Undibacterium sp. Di27W]|uniref:hypothetical protein n=1 Tax=Undibacterium sp. Di27W TaxID=3413036 RepID=UPI003BF23B9D